MKKTRQLLVSLLASSCLVSFLPFVANADAFYEGSLNYTILTSSGSNRTVRIDGYRTAPTSNAALVIPDTVTHSGVTYKVTAIANEAFKDIDTITSVRIGKYVSSVGSYAFYDCDGITTVTNNSNTVLTTLGNECFRGCDALTTVTLPTSITTISGGLGGGCFENCGNLTTVNFSQLTHLETIQRAAFYECTSLTGLSLPDSVREIGEMAFANCDSITIVNIPNSLTTLGSSSFYDCDGLLNIISGDSCVLTELGNTCFRDCDSLRTVQLPTSLETITGGFGGGSFERCGALTNVNFSQLTNLKTIERAAFYECGSLTGITLPDNLETIGDMAFANCDSITTVNIPNSLTSLGSNAFFDCDGLLSITSGDSCVLTELGNTCFRECDALRTVQLPRSLETINGGYGGGAFEQCSSLTSVNFEELTNLKTIGRAGFYYCTSLTRINLPASIETIGDLAFYGCGLDTVVLPANVAPSVTDATFEKENVTVYVPVGSEGYQDNEWMNYNVVYGNPPAPTSTPAPTSEPTARPTAAPSTPAPTSAPSAGTPSEEGASGFVERLYTVALGRSSDPTGQASWVSTLTSGENTGADVARGFLYSPEFLNKDVTDEEFVRVLYRTFFDREADEGGLQGWVGELANGKSKEHVIEGFINSTEWANLCLSYGIPSGGTGTPSIEVEPNQQVIDFCTRLYTTCLNREADPNGLMAWARQLANQRDSGSGAARGFFFSSEFTNQNVSNGEYVIRLYRTFMDRDPDQAGYDAWVAQLDEGVSRDVVFEGFAQSPEFTRICASYGIVR